MNIVIFSGAGMSAESGISTFRDTGGLWEKYKVEDVATPDAWKRNPELVQDFYNQRRKQILDSSPNQAHQLIASLEEKYNITVITQNIDDLHERAGSSHVLHLHGNIQYAKSSGPNAEKIYYKIEGWKLKMSDKCPDGYPLRPHVVWFGEEVPMYETAIELIKSADILVVIGTSLNVYPAAGLINYVNKGCRKYIIDPNVSELTIPTDFHPIPLSANEGVLEFIRLIS